MNISLPAISQFLSIALPETCKAKEHRSSGDIQALIDKFQFVHDILKAIKGDMLTFCTSTDCAKRVFLHHKGINSFYAELAKLPSFDFAEFNASDEYDFPHTETSECRSSRRDYQNNERIQDSILSGWSYKMGGHREPIDKKTIASFANLPKIDATPTSNDPIKYVFKSSYIGKQPLHIKQFAQIKSIDDCLASFLPHKFTHAQTPELAYRDSPLHRLDKNFVKFALPNLINDKHYLRNVSLEDVQKLKALHAHGFKSFQDYETVTNEVEKTLIIVKKVLENFEVYQSGYSNDIMLNRYLSTFNLKVGNGKIQEIFWKSVSILIVKKIVPFDLMIEALKTSPSATQLRDEVKFMVDFEFCTKM